MIKNCLNKHIDLNHITMEKKHIIYTADDKKRYIIFGKYEFEKIESVMLVCTYYQNSNFCLIKCMQNVNSPQENQFNILISENDYSYEKDNEFQYLVNKVYELIKTQTNEEV